MRRWLILLLLTVLPLQFASAAVAGYCLHESDAAVGHVGHHQHKHQTAAGKTSVESTEGHKAGDSVGPDDPDCGYCHFGATHPLLQDFSQPANVPDVIGAFQDVLSFGTRDPDTLDRPNWPALA